MTSTGARGGGGSAGSSKGAGWGVRSGTGDDKGVLSDIITAELNKTGNRGNSFVFIFFANFLHIESVSMFKVWMRILLRLLIKHSMRATRPGRTTILLLVPGNR